ncbi:MAG: hypothetical protein DRI54_04660 [Bacteroidetes bacterium]|nr:MAG: hypothetical protein DRI54_04660 [Bacteroidota bacterium]
MEISYYKIENNAIARIDHEIKSNEWSKKLDWVNIRVENRKELADYFQESSVYKDARDYIEHPENHPFANTFDNFTLLNLPISSKQFIYKADYISVIIEQNFVLSIIPQSNKLILQKDLLTYSDKKFPSLQNFLIYTLSGKILTQSNLNIGIVRGYLESAAELIKSDPGKLSSNQLTIYEQEISQLSDIIEDQYFGFETLVLLNSPDNPQDNTDQTNKRIKGFEALDKAMQRLQKRAESLRLQYMLFQQERSTRKINVLTIVQAVFVPLTFIAGIYGMNFINMPELKLSLGYLYVWILFIVLAGGLLTYFYKHGWFK